MLISIKEIIPRRVKKLKIKESIFAGLVCELANKKINELLKIKSNNPDLIIKISFKEGVLRVRVNNSMYLNEIKLNEEVIKTTINKNLKKEIVKEIIF